MTRSLATYTTEELVDMKNQGLAMIPSLPATAVERMVDILCALKNEITARAVRPNFAAAVCGYAADGTLLDAKANHTFARVRAGRR